jgi:integrase/recombinase XerD
MLEFLFPRDRPRYAAGPHGPLVRDFSAWGVERGYTRICAKRHVHRFREVLAYNHVAAGANFQITSTALSRWFAPWSHETLYRATQRAAARFLTNRGLFVPVAKPGRFDPLVSQYRSHLIDLRGLSPSTVEQHLSTVTGFLASACSGRRRLASVRSEDIEHFIEQTSKRFCRQSLQHTVAHLRAFLRFCADRGYTRNRLDVIDTPRTYRKRGRKQRFDEAIFEERFRTIERVFAWEDKFRRLLLRFERISQMHYALKTLAYTMINLRHYCRH